MPTLVDGRPPHGSTGARCSRTTRRSGSTARSAGAPTSSASSRSRGGHPSRRRRALRDHDDWAVVRRSMTINRDPEEEPKKLGRSEGRRLDAFDGAGSPIGRPDGEEDVHRVRQEEVRIPSVEAVEPFQRSRKRIQVLLPSSSGRSPGGDEIRSNTVNRRRRARRARPRMCLTARRPRGPLGRGAPLPRASAAKPKIMDCLQCNGRTPARQGLASAIPGSTARYDRRVSLSGAIAQR